MSRRSLLALVALIVCMSGPAAHAEIQSTGIDTERLGEPAPAPPSMHGDCRVLWFGGDAGFEVDRLASLGYVVTPTADPTQLTVAQLSAYDVLVISFTPAGLIASAQPAIMSFVHGGGGLLIHQPNAVGALDYAPEGFSVTISNHFWCDIPGGANSLYVSAIVNASHPITAGLTNADLSGDFDSVHEFGPGYTVLTRNVDCPESVLALGAGALGAGHVVFEDGNLSLESFRPGSDAYWRNVFSWLCAGAIVPARAATWGTLKAVYR